jgi:RND family efflux transporter MFP subunit
MLVDVGSSVAEGELLAQIEPRDYELRVQQAEAALAQARAAVGLGADQPSRGLKLEDLNTVREARALLDEAGKNRQRVQSLAKAGIAPQSEVDAVEATYKVAVSRHQVALEEARSRLAAISQRDAESDLARKQLADTSIRAPFKGIVQRRPGAIGQFVAAGTPIIELVKADPLRLRLGVPERFASQVRPGQEVRLIMSENDTNRLVGALSRLSPALDEESRTLPVEADIPAHPALRPGLFARAELILTRDEAGVAVPPNGIVTFAGIEKVVVESGGKALEKVVTTGRRGPGWIEIVEGLKAGDRIVLDPSGLKTGNPLVVTNQGDGGMPQTQAIHSAE